MYHCILANLLESETNDSRAITTEEIEVVHEDIIGKNSEVVAQALEILLAAGTVNIS